MALDEILLLVFTGVVSVATAAYAILTWKLTAETRRMRQAQTEPMVSIWFAPRPESINFVDLIVRNTGLGPAFDVEFVVTPDFEYDNGRFLSQLNLMANGVPYLAPGQTIQFFLTSLIERFDQKINTPFVITARYRDAQGKQFANDYTIAFSQLEGLAQLGEPPLMKMAKHIEQLERDFHHVTTGFHQLHVVTYTKQEFDRRYEIVQERQQERNTQGAHVDEGRSPAASPDTD